MCIYTTSQATKSTTVFTMMAVEQATMIASDENDVGDDGFALDLSAFSAGASFSLAAWGPCHAMSEQEEKEHCSNAERTLHSPWRRPPTETNCWSISPEDTASGQRRRVRFSPHKPQVLHYARPTTDDWSRLYYSCHELQTIIDEYRLEQQAEKDWQAECASFEEERLGQKLDCFQDDNEATAMNVTKEVSKCIEGLGAESIRIQKEGALPRDQNCDSWDEAENGKQPSSLPCPNNRQTL